MTGRSSLLHEQHRPLLGLDVLAGGEGPALERQLQRAPHERRAALVLTAGAQDRGLVDGAGLEGRHQPHAEVVVLPVRRRAEDCAIRLRRHPPLRQLAHLAAELDLGHLRVVRVQGGDLVQEAEQVAAVMLSSAEAAC
jgi:hypothetical protein